MDDDGNGDGTYVTHAEFSAHVKRNEEDLELHKLALFGKDGRGGLCKDVGDILHLLKTYGVLLGIVSGIISPIIVTLLIRIFWS